MSRKPTNIDANTIAELDMRLKSLQHQVETLVTRMDLQRHGVSALGDRLVAAERSIRRDIAAAMSEHDTRLAKLEQQVETLLVRVAGIAERVHVTDSGPNPTIDVKYLPATWEPKVGDAVTNRRGDHGTLIALPDDYGYAVVTVTNTAPYESRLPTKVPFHALDTLITDPTDSKSFGWRKREA